MTLAESATIIYVLSKTLQRFIEYELDQPPCSTGRQDGEISTT